MRIIAGKNRGLRLAAVGKGDAGAHLRPTTDRVRESLFNILNNQIDFGDIQVLDLFAGTGALGLETLSRGATHCTFVENGRVGQALIRDNIKLTRQTDAATLLRCNATKLPKGSPCDLIFLDPPYGKNLGNAALICAQENGWVAPDALIVWEEAQAMACPNFTVIDTRKFGGTIVTLLTPT
ncbi:MAG: 16S rRNA (guanine(966)-N(2))-methyltransferase RsmD [Planktomarina sp.]